MNNNNGTASTPSFVEAQRRLAARRHERVVAEAAEIRERAAAAAAAAAAARRQRTSQSGSHGMLQDQFLSLQRVGAMVQESWPFSTLSTMTSSSTSSSTSPFPSFRVGQVDAELLDEELLTLLRGQVTDALRYVRGGTLGDDWDAEILLVLRAALFKLTVWDHDATYGAALQNLRYCDARSMSVIAARPARWQKALHGLVTVGGRYAWTKWEDWLRDGEDEFGEEEEEEGNANGDTQSSSRQGWLMGRLNRSHLIRLTTWASDAYAAAALISFLVFLRHGRYRTLLDRLLRMRLVPPTSQVSREVSFEYLNRQLVWHAFTEFLLFLLPLVGIHRWRRWATRVWRRLAGAAGAVASAATSLVSRGADGDQGVDASVDKSPATGELAFLPERTCAICYQDQNSATSEADMLAEAAASSGVVGSAETDITNPYETVPCGCVYCYVCVATRIEREEGDGWTCLRCGTLARSCRPWSGDVLEKRETSDMTVGATGIVEAVDDDAEESETDRPLSSSSHQHKTVGFADDVKGEEEQGREGARSGESSDDGIIVEEEEDVGNYEDSPSDAESEAYEEEEEELEGGDEAFE